MAKQRSERAVKAEQDLLRRMRWEIKRDIVEELLRDLESELPYGGQKLKIARNSDRELYIEPGNPSGED